MSTHARWARSRLIRLRRIRSAPTDIAPSAPAAPTALFDDIGTALSRALTASRLVLSMRAWFSRPLLKCTARALRAPLPKRSISLAIVPTARVSPGIVHILRSTTSMPNLKHRESTRGSGGECVRASIVHPVAVKCWIFALKQGNAQGGFGRRQPRHTCRACINLSLGSFMAAHRTKMAAGSKRPF